MISFPFPSPVAFFVGSWPIYWYGILFIGGLYVSWRYGLYVLDHKRFPPLKREHMERFFQPLLLGVIIGGRLGDILLYRPWILWTHPVEIFYTREGGMSFHGGFLGCCMACWLYCFFKKLPFGVFLNFLSCCAPLGLFFGRLGNFINQELYGYPTQSFFAMVFPLVDEKPRHPSPLYEAFGEGLLLFGFMTFLTWRGPYGHPKIKGFFLLGYSVCRYVAEFFRVDSDGSFLSITLGQWYSFPLFVGGLIMTLEPFTKKSRKHHPGLKT